MLVRTECGVEPRAELADIESTADVEHFHRPCHFAYGRGARSICGIRLYSFVSDYALWFAVAAHIMLAGHRA